MHIRSNDRGKYEVLDENDLILRTVDTYAEAAQFVEQAQPKSKKS